MLYQLYETQRALMAPFSEFASATAKLYNHPLSPFTHTPMAQRVAAGLDLMHRLAKEYEKPAFGITAATVGSVEVAVQEQVALDLRNRPIDATRGVYLLLSAEQGGVYTGSAFSYQKFMPEIRGYYTLGNRFTIAARVQFGHIFAQGEFGRRKATRSPRPRPRS